MSNSVTHRLGLVKTTQFEGLPLLGVISWFDRVVPAIKGINQEIFREDNYIGSVYEPGYYPESATSIGSLSVKAHKGDIIYLVNLTPQPDKITGIITSKDRLHRMYDIQLQLLVNNSKKFVESYRADKDPAGSTINAFKTVFEHFFSKHTHDEIDHFDSSNVDINKLNQTLSDRFGIIVVSPNWYFHPDSYHEKELEIQRKIELRKKEFLSEIEMKVFELKLNAELRKEELNTNALLQVIDDQIRRSKERTEKQFERDEKVKQNVFMREEKIKSNLYEARIKLLSTTVNDLTAINTERLRDAFDSNASVRAILEETLKLLAVFTEPNRKNEEVIESTLLNDSTIDSADEEERETTI